MLQRATPRIVLASGSASRRAVLAAAGLRFEVHPTDIDEAAIKREVREANADATAAALRLADEKARRIAQDDREALVIGADQILVCGDAWFDKPAGIASARDQLRALRGQDHSLTTAVVCHEGGRRVWHHVAAPRLAMRQFSDAFLETYLTAEGDAVTTTVGAYRIEGLGAHLFTAIDGDHATVLGLPLLPLLGFLRSRGILVD